MRISVIIPCYNSEDTLEEAFLSAYKQGIPEEKFEVVMCDDASTDGTRVLMEKLSKEHKNVKLVFHEKNRGGGATRNTATRASTGETIFCLDSDDLLPDGVLSKMTEFMAEKNCDGVGIEKSIKFRDKDTNDVVLIHNFGYVGERIPFESLLQINDVYCPLYSTFLITRSAFETIGGYPENHGFDTQGIAWRFLASGFIAYTCPRATYLHRIEYKASYYLREAEAGKVNANWQDIFLENLDLFDEDTREFILSFDTSDFSKNIFEEMKKRDRVFAPNYKDLLIPGRKKETIEIKDRKVTKRNSAKGIYIRLCTRIKQGRLRSPLLFIYGLYNRLKRLFNESDDRKEYYEEIERIKNNKKVVVDLNFGGIGDCLAWSTLPRLLKEKYDIDFYLSEKSLEILRHKDTYKLVFEMNPYFKGISNDTKVFRIKLFESEKSLYTLLTDKEGQSIIEILESQFDLKGRGRPEIYYKPNDLPALKNVILVDDNTISGKRFGWIFEDNAFQKEAEKHEQASDVIEFVDPKKQDFFTYVDMIYSSKYFVATFSGGASIAACFDKPFSVIWPLNGKNGSNYQFRYKKSFGQYV